MNRQLSLFAPVGAARPSREVSELAAKLEKKLYFGTSSWSFPGWEGIVYDSNVSQTALARHGLAAYAEHPLFRTVCIDRTYYAPMTAEELAEYRESVPASFRFVVKAHELVTRVRAKDDYSADNPTFLDASYAMDEVVGPCLEGLGDRAAILLFQFPPQRVESVDRFADELGQFFEALPKEVTYSVELRNPELLTDRYRDALAAAGATHCFNVHPTMPSIEEQARRIPPKDLSTVLIRWMLRRTRTYGDAKDAFHPFNQVRDPDDASRDAIAEVCREAKRAFVIVNNKAEGCAPKSLVRLAEAL